MFGDFNWHKKIQHETGTISLSYHYERFKIPVDLESIWNGAGKVVHIYIYIIHCAKNMCCIFITKNSDHHLILHI